MANISIKDLQNILLNERDFLSFLQGKGIYANIKSKQYIILINKCMKVLISESGILKEDVFSRINYINNFWKIDIVYDYRKYLLNKRNLFNWQIARCILNNDEIFKKFMDYEQNKKFFDNQDLEYYLNIMTDIFTYFNKSELGFSLLEEERYYEIVRKYLLDLKRNDFLLKEVKLNDEFKQKVLGNVILNESDFYVARVLYIRLCKLLRFDFNVFAYMDQENDENFEKIYYKNISEVGEKHNEIVCATWASMYCTILHELGIKAMLAGKRHKYVILDADGVLIKADATKNICDSFAVSMNDLTRVQNGLKTKGFICLESDRDIENECFYVDTLSGEYLQEIDERCSLLEDSTDDRYDKLVANLKDIFVTNKINNLEFMRYIGGILQYLKAKKIYDLNYYYVATKVADNYFCNIILFFELNKESYYFWLGKDGLKRVCFNEIKRNVEEKKVKILGKYNKVPGIL